MKPKIQQFRNINHSGIKTLATLMLCAGLSAMSYAQYNKENLQVKETVAFTYKNLRLYPVYANQVFLMNIKTSANIPRCKKPLLRKK
jgi:hypothetical protein